MTWSPSSTAQPADDRALEKKEMLGFWRGAAGASSVEASVTASVAAVAAAPARRMVCRMVMSAPVAVGAMTNTLCARAGSTLPRETTMTTSSILMVRRWATPPSGQQEQGCTGRDDCDGEDDCRVDSAAVVVGRVVVACTGVIAARRAAPDGVDVDVVGCGDDQPHLAFVSHQSGDAAVAEQRHDV